MLDIKKLTWEEKNCYDKKNKQHGAQYSSFDYRKQHFVWCHPTYRKRKSICWVYYTLILLRSLPESIEIRAFSEAGFIQAAPLSFQMHPLSFAQPYAPAWVSFASAFTVPSLTSAFCLLFYTLTFCLFFIAW